MAAKRKLGFDANLDRLQTELLEPTDLRLHEVFEGDLGQRWPEPQAQRRAQHLARLCGIAGIQRATALPHALRKHSGVEVARREREHVATAHHPQPGLTTRVEWLQGFSQARDRHRQTIVRTRTFRSPHRVDQRVARHGPVGVQHQKANKAS